MKPNRTFGGILAVVIAAFALSACNDAADMLGPAPETQSVSPLTRAAQDAMTIADFRRSYGVGFSYDGIWGEPCNFRDVHSRVLDLTALRNWTVGNGEDLFSSSITSGVTIECTTAFSQSQYKQETTFYADVATDLILFNGAYQTSASVYEEGVTNNFFCDVNYVAPAMRMEIQDATISSLVKEEGLTELLTPNFRETIEWIDKHRSTATIDSFLICYGSHVVTSASVGGSIKIHMNMDHDSLTTIYSNQSLGEATIAKIMNSTTMSDEYQKELSLLNSADCSVTVRGGDLSAIPNDLLHFRFGECPNLAQYIDAWQKSLNYDPDDYAHNNLEMTSFTVIPIWEFIPNEDVARLVRLRVEGTATELISEIGYQNYTNTSFKLPQSVTCKMGGNNTTFNQPAIVNVIASGRYVATICREQIELPEVGVKEVQVVYPIYNQQVNLRSGYTTYGNSAYTVRWVKDKCKVVKDTKNTPAADGTIYMTYGVPGSVRYTNVKYQPSYEVIGYEWPYSIKIDGSVDTSKPYYLTYKNGTDFLLRNVNGSEQSGKLDGLPNWSLKNGRMVRNKEYNYYWNPNEVNY